MKSIFFKRKTTSILCLILLGVISYNCADENLEGTYWYQDLDGDTFGNPNIRLLQDMQPTGYVSNYLDCDDTNDAIYITAVEIPDNEIDENCDAKYAITLYVDNDEDGFGHQTDSQIFELEVDDDFPDGFVNNNTDCNDNDSLINLLVAEILDNDVDENCDGTMEEGTLYKDSDGDGYGSDEIDLDLGVPNNLDCDDSDAQIHPYAREIQNGIDDDCDGTIDELF